MRRSIKRWWTSFVAHAEALDRTEIDHLTPRLERLENEVSRLRIELELLHPPHRAADDKSASDRRATQHLKA